MTEPIKHHYLPVFYLSAWCDPGGKIVRRPYREVVASPITPHNTGYEPRLYTPEGVSPDRQQALETEFMTPWVDTPASQAIRLFLDRTPEKQTPELRSAWTRFLLAMRFRNPDSLAEVTAASQTALKDGLSDPNDPDYLAVKVDGDPPTLWQWVQEKAPHIISNIGKTFLPGLIDHDKIADHIINMRWGMVDVTQGGVPLLTGDQPFISTSGLIDDNCLIALPLSPTLLFTATNRPRAELDFLSKGVKYFASAINSQIVTQAARYVYGNTADHLSVVEIGLRKLSSNVARSSPRGPARVALRTNGANFFCDRYHHRFGVGGIDEVQTAHGAGHSPYDLRKPRSR